MIFYNLLWFSKYLVELNKKENDKTVTYLKATKTGFPFYDFL
jgi:hypothetical protein